MSELSLRKYGYKVGAPKDTRLYSLYLACLDYDKTVVMNRMKKLGLYHPVMLEDCEEYFGTKAMRGDDVVDPVDAEVVVSVPLMLQEPVVGTAVNMSCGGHDPADEQIEIEIEGVEDALNIFSDLCSIINETKALSIIEDAVANITEHLRIEDEKWQKFKDNFHAKRDKMVSEFNDFEKCVEVLAKHWNGENWLSGFLSEEFFKVSKEQYQKTMKQMEKIELQSKKLKQRKLCELTTSKEIFEVRFLRTEMKVMCEELFKLFPVARFYNLLKLTAC